MNIAKEIAALKYLATSELQNKYCEVFGEDTHCRNKPYLVRRIAWRLQAKAEGGLSERALKRAEELAQDADLRTRAPGKLPDPGPADLTKTLPARLSDTRIPIPGSLITRQYKGKTIRVQVLAGGFEHDGTVYRSLSAVAKTVTGSHMNGFLFFKLR